MKTKIFSLVAAGITLGIAACNNDSNNTASTDSTTTTNSTTTSSSGNYAAQADSFKVNSEAGNYLDARTGKPIKINVDPNTGTRVNAETNEPVRYYVDKRTWWVYGDNSWDSIGSARMEGDKLLYRGDNNQWVPFDQRWKNDTASSTTNNMDTSSTMKSENESKIKSGNTKVKTEKNETKAKTGK